MRKRFAFFFTLIVTAASGQTITTPAPAPAPAPEWANIETVEVQAHPGPAVWHIARGKSDVWILGTVGGLPKGVTWNTSYLAELLRGSRALVLPPLKIDFLSYELQFDSPIYRFPRGKQTKLDEVLTEPERLRLTAMQQSVGSDPEAYQYDRPFGAANRLSHDFAKKYQLDGEYALDAVVRLARRYDVPYYPVFSFNPNVLIEQALQLTSDGQRACFSARLDDLEGMAVHARPMAEAWAVGDIKNVKANFVRESSVDCLAATLSAVAAAVTLRDIAYFKAIKAALDKPGKTVVVIGLGPLLNKGGILEALQAHNLPIEGPKER